MYPVVTSVGNEAIANSHGRDIGLPVWSKIVRMKTETIPATITPIPRFPSKPNAYPVDFARGRLSV
jgi:hypothetical protein